MTKQYKAQKEDQTQRGTSTNKAKEGERIPQGEITSEGKGREKPGKPMCSGGFTR
jgi:hypothetical protein